MAQMRLRAPQLRSDLEAFALSKRMKPELVDSYIPEAIPHHGPVDALNLGDIKFDSQGIPSPKILPKVLCIARVCSVADRIYRPPLGLPESLSLA